MFMLSAWHGHDQVMQQLKSLQIRETWFLTLALTKAAVVISFLASNKLLGLLAVPGDV